VIGQLELDGPSRLLLADGCAGQGIAVRRYILDAEGHDIAAAKLAVDGDVEQCQVAGAARQL
jgi:hypothetical protein